MEKAETTANLYKARGIRLYVNSENSHAKHLYDVCGYSDSGNAVFMEKSL